MRIIIFQRFLILSIALLIIGVVNANNPERPDVPEKLENDLEEDKVEKNKFRKGIDSFRKTLSEKIRKFRNESKNKSKEFKEKFNKRKQDFRKIKENYVEDISKFSRIKQEYKKNENDIVKKREYIKISKEILLKRLNRDVEQLKVFKSKVINSEYLTEEEANELNSIFDSKHTALQKTIKKINEKEINLSELKEEFKNLKIFLNDYKYMFLKIKGLSSVEKSFENFEKIGLVLEKYSLKVLNLAEKGVDTNNLELVLSESNSLLSNSFNNYETAKIHFLSITNNENSKINYSNGRELLVNTNKNMRKIINDLKKIRGTLDKGSQN